MRFVWCVMFMSLLNMCWVWDCYLLLFCYCRVLFVWTCVDLFSQLSLNVGFNSWLFSLLCSFLLFVLFARVLVCMYLMTRRASVRVGCVFVLVHHVCCWCLFDHVLFCWMFDFHVLLNMC